MVMIRVLALCVTLVYSAPPKELRSYGLGTGGGVGYSDSFRPRFPGVEDVQMKEIGEGNIYLFKSAAELQPNPDKHPISQKPVGAEADPDATIVHKPVGVDTYPSEKVQGEGGDHVQKPVYRDVVEKPIIEKTVIKECDCEKHIEEKHIDEPVLENNPVDEKYVPEESQYQSSVVPAKPDLTVYDSKVDPYDVPVNPDFGNLPSEASNPDESVPKVEDMMPVEPELVHPEEPVENPQSYPDVPVIPVEMIPDDKVPMEGPGYPVEETKEPSRPNPDYDYPSHPAEEQPEVPKSPDMPVELPKKPVEEHMTPDGKEPLDVIPNKDTPKETYNIPSIEGEPSQTEKPNHGYDTEFAKEPVEIPKGSDVDVVQPEASVNEEVPNKEYPKDHVYSPKSEVEPDVPLVPEQVPEKEYPKDHVDVPMSEVEPEVPLAPKPEETEPAVDVKPEAFEPVVPERPVDGVDEKPDVPPEMPVEVPLTPVDPSGSETKPVEPIPSISTVCEDMGLRKFLYLLNKAGYKDMLNRKRPLTIFVPSDEAWQRLPLPVLNRIQRDRGFLRRVLRYHMVDGVEQGQVRQDYYCPSMQQGAGLFLNTFGKNMYVNGLPALGSQVRPSNGAVYVIQRVLFPFPASNLAEAIQSTGTFTRFFALAAEAGLLDRELSAPGPFTLFAPTDVAFSKLPAKTVEWLSWDRAALRELLMKHLVAGTHYSSFVPEEEHGHLKSVNGAEIEVKHADTPGEFEVNGANLVAHDLTTRNGVLHAVDEVLFANELHPKPFVRPLLRRIYA